MKKYWSLIVVAVLILLLLKTGTGNIKSRREISRLNDSIQVLEHEYSVIQDSLSASRKVVLAFQIREALYHDSLNAAKQQIKINNVRHEIQVANLIRIPSDSLYSELTRWLDSISFQ